MTIFFFIFIILVSVLMILWLVLCIETTRQISGVENHLKQRGSGRIMSTNDKLNDLLPEKRFLTSLYSQLSSPQTSAISSPITITRSLLPRLFILAIFNTIIEEFIALISIISLILLSFEKQSSKTMKTCMNSNNRSTMCFHTSLLLLSIIWFIEQYRIGDLIYYHQNFNFDFIDSSSSSSSSMINGQLPEQTSINVQQLIIASHLIHLIILIFGAIICLSGGHYGVNSSLSTRISSSTAATINSINGNNKHINNCTSTTTITSLNGNVEAVANDDSRQILINQNNENNTHQQSTSNDLAKTKSIGQRFRKPCNWMRSTFVVHNSKCNNNNNNNGNKHDEQINNVKPTMTMMMINHHHGQNDEKIPIKIAANEQNECESSSSSTSTTASTASTTIAMDRLIDR